MQTSKAAESVRGMLRIRRFEEQCIKLAGEEKFPGHYHVYIGQEATATAACAALGSDDFVFSTWRNHGHLLARGAAPEPMMAEILGRADGYCGGRSGTLHLAVRELGVPTTSALVGGSLPLAIGSALACKRRGSGVTVAFFGDAALEEGAFYEALVVAQVWKVPILLVCENNSIPPDQRKRGQYTSSTLPAARLGDVPHSLQIPTHVVDGTDADALSDCFEDLVARVRKDGAPHFVEVCNSRWPGSKPLWPEMAGGEWRVAWAFGERPDHAEMAEWLEHADPLVLYLRKLAAAGQLSRQQVEDIDAEVRAEMAGAARFALESPLPAAAEAYRHVWAQEGAGR